MCNAAKLLLSLESLDDLCQSAMRSEEALGQVMRGTARAGFGKRKGQQGYGDRQGGQRNLGDLAKVHGGLDYGFTE